MHAIFNISKHILKNYMFIYMYMYILVILLIEVTQTPSC